jgi:hypothetical protein
MCVYFIQGAWGLGHCDWLRISDSTTRTENGYRPFKVEILQSGACVFLLVQILFSLSLFPFVRSCLCAGRCVDACEIIIIHPPPSKQRNHGRLIDVQFYRVRFVPIESEEAQNILSSVALEMTQAGKKTHSHAGISVLSVCACVFLVLF